MTTIYTEYTRTIQDAQEVADRVRGTAKCAWCGRPVPDYAPEMCCTGRDCGCLGLPIEPPMCGECDATKPREVEG